MAQNWLNYSIVFRDRAEYLFALGLTPAGDGFIGELSPVAAATLFGITWPPVGDPLGEGIPTISVPFQYVDSLGNGLPVLWPIGGTGTYLDTGYIYDPNVSSWSIDGGFYPPQPAWGPYQDQTYTWDGIVVWIPPDYASDEPDVALIPPRRWIVGFESRFYAQQCHPQAGSGRMARNSSRISEGFGFCLRESAAVSSIFQNVLSNSDGAGLPSKNSWERFYFRIQKAGVSSFNLWIATGSVLSASGGSLVLNSDLSISVCTVNGAGVPTTLATISGLELDTWYKCDILIKFSIGPTIPGTLRVYLSGGSYSSQELVASISTTSAGLGTNQDHSSSSICSALALNHGWELDMDDWHNAEIPNILGAESLTSLDWLTGTHVKAVYSDPTVAITSPSWTGIGAGLEKFVHPDGSITIVLTSVTALSIITDLTEAMDYGTIDDSVLGYIYGPACAVVSTYGSQAGGAANNGSLRYSIAGGAVIPITTVLGSTVGGANISYFPSGSIIPYPIEPLEISYIKGNSISNTTIHSLNAFVQYIGVWGAEDPAVSEGESFLITKGLLHNAPYPSIQLIFSGPQASTYAGVIGGTYVGNGTFQDIQFIIPVHFLIIRNVTTPVAPVIWNSTELFPTTNANPTSGEQPRVWMDADGVTNIRVVGNSSVSNASGSTFQYFAFSDPGMLFLFNGEFAHGNSTATFVNNLYPYGPIDWTPEFGFFFIQPDTASNIANTRGPGHTGLQKTNLIGTLSSTGGAEFGAGTISSGANLTSNIQSTAYSAFRSIGLDCSIVMTQILTYTGDGTGSRVINLTPVSGRFPLIAIVAPVSTGTTHYRDPSHTGTNSANLSTGANSATAITAGGIDTITVGATLNANGIIYNVLVVPGSPTSWANGTYFSPLCSSPEFIPDPDPFTGIAVMMDGGLTLGDSVAITLLQDLSGIYTLVPGKHSDTMYDRQTSQTSVELEIPDPNFRTGFIGG